MMGGKTSGGLRITSRPPPPPELAGRAMGEELWLAEGVDDGDEDEDVDGDVDGVGEGGPSRVKLAHGVGGPTLAQRLCSSTRSPGYGVTVVVKAPLRSVVTLAATLFGESQYRVTSSWARNCVPLTVILVVGPPAAVSRTMFAFGWGVGVGDGATSRNQTGTSTRNLSAFIRTREGYAIRSGARESTRPRSVPGTATAGRARRASGGGACPPRRGSAAWSSLATAPRCADSRAPARCHRTGRPAAARRRSPRSRSSACGRCGT